MTECCCRNGWIKWMQASPEHGPKTKGWACIVGTNNCEEDIFDNLRFCPDCGMKLPIPDFDPPESWSPWDVAQHYAALAGAGAAVGEHQHCVTCGSSDTSFGATVICCHACGQVLFAIFQTGAS